MPRVTFTPNLQRHVACPTVEVSGATVREVLDAVFAGNAADSGDTRCWRGKPRRSPRSWRPHAPVRDRRLGARVTRGAHPR